MRDSDPLEIEAEFENGMWHGRLDAELALLGEEAELA
jgi:hypothetical protein